MLAADSSDSPGSLLESWSVTAPKGGGGGGQTLPTETVTDQDNLTLDSGTRYWVELISPDQTSEHLFQDTDVGLAPSTIAYSNDGSSWTLPGFAVSVAFEVDGQSAAAPEPASLGLIGFGLAGLGLAGRRRKRATD